ncbi:MAG: hypothetical protein K6G48_04540 [Acholeplasmatales bacterium]|nr:hypothetical protein [Acholeplasmatales bacterium]
MKRRLIALVMIVFVLVLSLRLNRVEAASVSSDYCDYTTFSYMQFSKGKLLKNYSDSELKPYIKQTHKRRFYGWRIAYMNYHVRCNFTSKTILSIVNDGTSEIEYELEQTETTMNKVSITAKGTLKTSVSGTIKKFKGGLDSALSIEKSVEESVTCKTSESLKITIDPGTKVNIYLKGSGYLTNGYATLYDMWLKSFRGAFEFFELVDVYPKIVKEKI